MARWTAFIFALLLVAWPGIGHAQHGRRSLDEVAPLMADCIHRQLGMPTEVYDMHPGYLIEIRLKGDPGANQDVQTPWPPKDTVAFVEVTEEVSDPGAFPAQHVVPVWTNDTPAYVVARNHGWFTFGIAGTTNYCLSGALGGL